MNSELSQLCFNSAHEWFNCSVFQDKSKSPSGKGFRLKHHKENPHLPLSPLYLNFRLLRSFPEALYRSAELFRLLTQEAKLIPYHLLADIPTSITPVVTLLSQQMKLPIVTPRGMKAYGSESVIDGVYSPGMEVALFDDVITTAASKFEAISILESVGLVVKEVFVFVDNEQGGGRQLQDAGYTLHAAWKISELIKFYRTEDRISENIYTEMSNYLSLP